MEHFLQELFLPIQRTSVVSKTTLEHIDFCIEEKKIHTNI